MDNHERLEKLKRLATLPELDNGFPSQQACIAWSNEVAPLLRFRNEYYERFVHFAQFINHTGLSSATLEPALNNMISIARQAVFDLESNPQKHDQVLTPSDLPSGSKMSLKERIENHPVVYFGGAVIVAFGMGFGAREAVLALVGTKAASVESKPASLSSAFVEQKIQDLIQDHNKQVAQLQDQYIEQQKEATSHANIDTYRQEHRAAAQEIAKQIDAANAALTQQMSALRSIDCGNPR